ncbi:MAG: hypothetical protein D6785_07605 [Planctomycetota bacterium]|nr:MAG: hypothetical protein D6785_07605 [Planctomycetota bacterium]
MKYNWKRNYFLFFLFIAFSTVLSTFCGCASSYPRAEQKSEPFLTIPAVSPKQVPLYRLATIPSEVGIWVHSGIEELGTYSVILEFDPQIIKLKRIKGGEPPFDSMPFANKEDFLKGKVKIMAYHVEEKGPVGQTLVAKLFFQGLQPGTSPLKLSLEMATNPEGKRLAHAKAFLSAKEVQVVIPDSGE